jgi:hypothetical protein
MTPLTRFATIFSKFAAAAGTFFVTAAAVKIAVFSISFCRRNSRSGLGSPLAVLLVGAELSFDRPTAARSPLIMPYP